LIYFLFHVETELTTIRIWNCSAAFGDL